MTRAGPLSFGAAMTTAGAWRGQRKSFLSFSRRRAGGGQSETGDQRFVFSGNPVTFTHTLVSPVEVINVWLVDFNSRMDLAVNNAGGQIYSDPDVALPFNPDGDRSGNNHSYGEFTFLVTGTAGDVLTFSVVSYFSGVTGNPTGGNSGVQAVNLIALQSAATGPILTIAPAAGGNVLITFPTAAAGSHVLYSNTNLNGAGTWTPVPNVTSDGTTSSVTVTGTGAAQFFALR